jgi:cytochrome P450
MIAIDCYIERFSTAQPERAGLEFFPEATMSTVVGSVSAPDDVPFLDIFDPKFDFNGPDVALARARSWYAQSPRGLVVLRYAEAQELLRDPRIGHNAKIYLERNGIVDGPIYDWFVPMLSHRNGEDHRRLRGLVNKAFTPRMINNLRPYIRAVAEHLTDQLATAQSCEFVNDFANKLPMAVMSQLLGVPDQDFDKFRTWSTDITFVFSLADGGDTQARVEAAVVGLNGYVDSLIADKTTVPADDLISALIAAQQDGDRISAEELRNLLVTLVFAAHDTTRYQLANTLVCFVEHHDQWTLLTRRPELAAQAVEEAIRFCPVVNFLNRFAMEDLEYNGLRIAQDTGVLIGVAAPQRDPRAFHNADSFDISVTRQTPPLQFGSGPHYCLGAMLARAELSEALTILANRLGPPSLTSPVTWTASSSINGPQALPLHFGQPS